MAPSLRCPKCSTVVDVPPGTAPVCPSCGFSGRVAPAAASASAPAARPAVAAAGSAPAPRAPGAAGAARGAGGATGKTVSPGLVALFTVITLGIYALFFWWRTSREVDGLHGRQHAHRAYRNGLFTYLIAVAVAFVAALVFVFAVAGSVAGATDPEASDLFGGVGLVAFILLLGAAVALLVGGIRMLVGEFRVFSSVREAEVRLGHGKPLRPHLYFWLPIGLSLVGAIPLVGIPFSIAGYVMTLVFMALTQSRLNAIWGRATRLPA